MTTAFEFKFALGDQKLLERLPREIRDVLLSTDEVFQRTVHPFLIDHTRKVFAQKGDPTGEPWQGYGNEPKYAQFKSIVLDLADPEDRLMRWRNIDGMQEWLYPSLTDRDHQWHVWRIEGLKAVFGTQASYAERLAQEGGVNPFGEKYPPRPILQMSDGQKAILDQAIEQTYKEMLRERGLL